MERWVLEWWSLLNDETPLTIKDCIRNVWRSERSSPMKGVFEIDWRLGSLIPWVFKLGSLHRLKIMIKHWDNSRIKINIFMLLIEFSHFNMQSHYCKLHTIGGKNALTNVFYRFNASQCTCRRWITSVINLHTCPYRTSSEVPNHAHKGLAPKCPLAYTNHK
jgi:hypothetical protein